MTRTRSETSDPVTTSATYRYRSFWNGSWGAWTQVSNGSVSLQDTKTMTDRKTPGYFKAVREGTAIPVSPMSSKKVSSLWIAGGGSCVIAKKSTPTLPAYEFEFGGVFRPPQVTASVPVTPSVDGNIALQEALSRAQTDCYDALTFVAEFRKTVEGVVTLRSRAMSIWERFNTRVLQSARKRRYKGLETAQILAEIWLEMRYMWRPLVYDMIAAEEAIRRLAAGVEDPLQRAYGTRENISQGSHPQVFEPTWVFPGVSTGIPGLSILCNRTAVVDHSVHASVGLIAKTREITMVDPVLTGWELVPFSFVLDWFISIGDSLAAFSPFATGQLQYATLAFTKTTTLRSHFEPLPQNNYVFLGSARVSCDYWSEVVEYERTPATPTPTLAIDVNLNVAKIVDLVALWATINRKSLTRLLRHF